jgi:alkylation response protein AidB-like acyl-CoA dehydrogenase
MYFDYREERELSPRIQQLKESAHEFAVGILRPAAKAIDRLGDPHDVIARDSPLWEALGKAYRMRYHAAGIAEEMGGLGLAGVALQVLFEELGWGSAGLAFTLFTSALPFAAVAAKADPGMVEEFVKPFVADSEAQMVGCWAFTEPEHGSDLVLSGHHEIGQGAWVSAAAGGEDEFVLTGQKAAWVSNATIASHALTYVRIETPGDGGEGGLFVVPLQSLRVSKSLPLNKLGQRALNQGDVLFHQTRIPRRYLLAAGAQAEEMRAVLLSFCHAVTAAIVTGVARAALEEALAYAGERVQGGKPIGEHQLVRKRLFELFTKVEACRALSRAAMVNHSEQPGVRRECTLAAKVFCSEAAFEVTHEALQLFGASGLMRDALVSKLFRDARTSLVEYGSNDVLSLLGARLLLGTGPSGG